MPTSLAALTAFFAHNQKEVFCIKMAFTPVFRSHHLLTH
jgi:hypothetical protein